MKFGIALPPWGSSLGEIPGVEGGQTIVITLAWSGGSLDYGAAAIYIPFNWKIIEADGGLLENDSQASPVCDFLALSCELDQFDYGGQSSFEAEPGRVALSFTPISNFDTCVPGVPTVGPGFFCAISGVYASIDFTAMFTGPTQFTFTADILDPAPVPEPATWAMLVAGFGIIGMAARRRQGRSLGRT